MMCALGFVWRLCISLDLTSISVLAPCADLLEKGWGWQRLVPYSDGNVDWTIFKEYLREYFIQNAGEIPALCASKKPEKDKNYFCRNASKFAARAENGEELRLINPCCSMARHCLSSSSFCNCGYL